MIFNNGDILADELDKAIKSFEHLKRRHFIPLDYFTTSNQYMKLLCFLFWVSSKVLSNLFRFILRETINTSFFNLQCTTSGYGCRDVRPHVNIYLSLRTHVIDEVSEIENIYIKMISWWK